MNFAVKKIGGILLAVAGVLYPVLVFVLLAVYKAPVRIVSLCVIALALAFFLAATGNASKDARGRRKLNHKNLLSSLFFLLIGTACFASNSPLFLKLYPLAVCGTFLFVFGTSLASPPNIVFRFATLKDKSILDSPFKGKVEAYCKKVTLVWCAFFLLNGAAAVWTAFFCNERIWAIYNGGVSYIIMGIIFGMEFLARIKMNEKTKNYFPITQFKADSRKDDHIVCYDDVWSKGVYKTWLDFLTDTAKMRKLIAQKNAQEFILHCNDYWLFLVTFVALLQSKKQVMLTANITPEFIKEMRKPGYEFWTDAGNVADTVYIPAALQKAPQVSEQEIRSAPQIVADDTRIHMFTSGSTGKPKDVIQRMTEFNEDNAFVFSKWGDEFRKRKLVATVSQHHIYGFLFTIALPFAAGVPFRRKRVEIPNEFEKLTDERYMIIAVPAFLKRTNEVEEKLPLNDCFIFTSGGVLLPEVAKRTNEVFGFWPVEVYGSTETSGIAYRQSVNGLEWTPFDNAQIWKNQDGCLVIKSPYIKDPKGFETADLVDIHPDGRFIMKGRSDSIVKIEEKRVSLTEVENRLLQSGLVRDVCVVAMSDRRQYLAAAISFNDEGKKKFEGAKKFDVNMFFHDYLMQFFENVVIPKKWRFLDAIPSDLQGKHKKLEIQALFTTLSC
ncbi:MAG: AMP-binding protein [Treponema sp.]|nr:AMP-binding protein [Treponema sp.]